MPHATTFPLAGSRRCGEPEIRFSRATRGASRRPAAPGRSSTTAAQLLIVLVAIHGHAGDRR